MHKNANFNIIQAPGNMNRKFVVIHGQRTDSGNKARGAVEVSIPMPRNEAIALADRLQKDHDAK